MDNLLWAIVEFVFACINVVLVYLFLRIFLKNNAKSIGVLESVIILSVIVAKFLSSYFINDNTLLFSIISVISDFFLAIAFYRVKKLSLLIPVAFSFLAGLISEAVAVFLFSGFGNVTVAEAMQYNIYRIQFRVLIYLVYLLIIMVVNRFHDVRKAVMTTKLMLGLCILPSMSILVSLQFIIHIVVPADTPTFAEVVPLMSIITVNIFVFILVENLTKQNVKEQELILVKSQNETHQQHIKDLIDTHEQLQKISHDFKHQANVLYTLCENKEYDKLSSNLKKILNNNPYMLTINTENIMLDAVLSSKKEECKRQTIDFILTLEVIPNLEFISLEYCVLLSNAIDNAIEACNRSVGKRKFIELELTANTTTFMFRMRNVLDEKPEIKNGVLETKKQDRLRHGIGLKSMRQTCDELGGNMDYEYDENYFKMWIYIPT